MDSTKTSKLSSSQSGSYIVAALTWSYKVYIDMYSFHFPY